ncbi:MAG: HlyC/CorC family transporter [Caldilineaceae bacterium]|jgi:CBS domain containing-hemolysin-like protein|nr:HlyC/CorC family transporter [Caldilineaceae bacterium]
MNWVIVAGVIIALVVVNGLYVAGEFSVVSARRSRLAGMAEAGNHTAAWLLDVLRQPVQLDRLVAACQLGITLSSLVLGFYGQANILRLLEPWLAGFDIASRAALISVTSIGILLALTGLQVLFGELIPKNIGLQYPEQTAIATATAMRWSMLLYQPLIWLFNGSAQVVLRLLGATSTSEHAHIHSPDEIVMLVEESRAGGVLAREETELLVNTLELRHETARRVMLPRNRMLAAPVDEPYDALLALLANSPYSRLPLYEEDIDHIVGFVHIRDLLHLHHLQRSMAGAALHIREHMRPVRFVPESIAAEAVLLMMQRHHQHLVIVVDEYGGTAGMITIEDLIEEIIGEFEDEFDRSIPALDLRADNRLWIRGDVPVDDLNDLFDLMLPANEVDTVGGLVTAVLGVLPKVGDVANIHTICLRVEEMDFNRVGRVSMALDEQQRRIWQEAQS